MIEQLREQVVGDLLAQGSVASVWPTWQAELQRRLAPAGTAQHVHQLFALGGKLTDVFQSTGGGNLSEIFVNAAIGPNDGRGVRSAVAACSSIPAYFGV